MMSPSAAALAIVLSAIVTPGCSSPPAPLRNRSIETGQKAELEPPEVRCSASQGRDGGTLVRYQVRNTGRKAIYVLDGRRMPYQLARDESTLVILHGVNPPKPGIIYEAIEFPPTRPLAPGEMFTGESMLGKPILRDHFDAKMTPASLLHGTIHVLCEVGWGPTPIEEPNRMPFREFMAWQHVTSSAPFDIVLP